MHGDFVELFIGAAFFVQSFLEPIGEFFEAENFGVGASTAVGGDFPVLDFLDGTDESGFEDTGVGLAFLLEEVLTFSDEAGHGMAGIAGGFLAEAFKNGLQTLEVHLGFFEALDEGLLEFGEDRGLDEVGESSDELLLRIVNITKFLNEEVLEGMEFHNALSKLYLSKQHKLWREKR